MSSLEEVINCLQTVTALQEKLFIEVCKAKKDTRIILRFLNNLCIEVAGDNQIDNS